MKYAQLRFHFGRKCLGIRNRLLTEFFPPIECAGTTALKKIGRRRSERSQSNREAEGGPRTPAPGRHEQGLARRLGMREGTVKVHVRQIMRKFGVTNRTQVAVVCANGRPSQKAATPAEF
jgi:hypothetical protein